VSAIIISPSRELALQIESEARRLCEFHTRSGALRGTLTVVGGQKITRDLKALKVWCVPITCTQDLEHFNHVQSHHMSRHSHHLCFPFALL
jgi:superfamily II DNA/RNA helicase